MSLRHAILGFLTRLPLSGYDLKKAFDGSVRHFWPADKAAIYRTLEELEGRGFVEGTRVAQESRPDRIEYRATPAGRAEFDRWLRTPLTPVARREPFLIQVFFSDNLDDASRDALFAAEIAAIEEEITGLQAVAAGLAAGPPLPPGPVLTLHAGHATCIAWRDWLVAARAMPRDAALAACLLGEITFTRS